MSRRGRPRKNSPQEPKNTDDDGEETIQENLDKENPTELSPQEEMLIETTPERSLGKPPKTISKLLDATEWSDIPVIELAKQGWTYRHRTDKDGREYMYIRNRTNEKSLGRYTPEREKLFFELYPILLKPKGVDEASVEASSEKGLGKRPFFNVPVKRVAVIPGDYRPTIDVIRYYHIFKNNGFLGDFSDFMNGIVGTHFVKCNGIVLPVFVNEELIQ